MFKWIGRQWRRRQRQIDRVELFPSLTVEAIAMHTFIDTAWAIVDEWKDEPEYKVFGGDEFRAKMNAKIHSRFS